MRQPILIKSEYNYTEPVRIAFFSDLHIDSSGCNIDELVKDLEYEKKKGARILINGDLIDGIMPQDIKRYSRGGDYGGTDGVLNEITENVADVLAPFAENIDVIGIGNHETAIIKHHGYDIVRAIIERIYSKTGHRIFQSGYRGFINYKFVSDQGGDYRSYLIFHHHGKGGSAPVTKGMIDLARIYTQFGSADILWIGHKHTNITDQSSPAIEVSSRGVLRQRQRIAFITPGYNSSIKIEEFGTPANNVFEDIFYSVNPTGYKVVEIYPQKRKMEVTK